MLLVPSVLCGRASQVRRRCAALARQALVAKHADPWLGLVASGLVEVGSLPGLLVLDGPSPLLGEPEDHVQVFAPLAALTTVALQRPESAPAMLAPAFEASLSEPWRLLLLLGRNMGQVVVQGPERRRRFLQAAAACWEELDAQGARYTVGSRSGARLWELPTTLQFALANEGFDAAWLRSPLPRNSLVELLRQGPQGASAYETKPAAPE